MDKFVAYDHDAYDYETFESLEKAINWIVEYNSQDGISEGAILGRCYVAKITHRSKFIELDRKADYHEHTDDCPEDCDEEEWPYDNDADSVGRIEMVPVEDDEIDAIRAEARTEALKDAADRAAEWYQMMYGKSWTQVVSELRAAITQEPTE
jgi:hypothetical protein